MPCWPLLTEDVVHDLNQGGRETGKEAFRRFLAHMDRCYREQLTDIVVMVSADGRRAAAEFVVHGTYLSTDPASRRRGARPTPCPPGPFSRSATARSRV